MKFQIKNEKYMLALLGLLVWACSSNNIDIENMRCEYQISPIGIDSPAPRFTWNYTTNNEDATEFYEYDSSSYYYREVTLSRLENIILEKVAAPKNKIKFTYNVEIPATTSILIPSDFNLLRYV